MSLFVNVKEWTHQLKLETYALYLAVRDPRTPWFAKLFVSIVVAYALSPIDLIPDFIPVLGYIDDLILIPLGIALAVKLLPVSVLTDCRKNAKKTLGLKKQVNWVAGGVIIIVWVVTAVLCFMWLYDASID